ncbi:hypothetical protein EVAR_38644_1 [Eumeta japonica]|uniref:Uncharacterized protein n=1 Tax=Eumeta variegata TaxID=151549 RepID=A0A4C1XXT3_EUMVA|nr:hypothetical protein EVAR_38644_1 [Eumeta japonica]
MYRSNGRRRRRGRTEANRGGRASATHGFYFTLGGIKGLHGGILYRLMTNTGVPRRPRADGGGPHLADDTLADALYNNKLTLISCQNFKKRVERLLRANRQFYISAIQKVNVTPQFRERVPFARLINIDACKRRVRRSRPAARATRYQTAFAARAVRDRVAPAETGLKQLFRTSCHPDHRRIEKLVLRSNQSELLAMCLSAKPWARGAQALQGWREENLTSKLLIMAVI